MSSSDNMFVGDLEVRPHEHEVLIRGQQVPLSSKEFEIVLMLAEHPGWVFSADQLSGDPDESGCSPESVSVLVHRVRQKLAAAGGSDIVETVRGFGYRLNRSVAPVDESFFATEARRGLRDAAWQLQEAVFEVDHLSNPDQEREVTDVLEQARRAIYAKLAE